MLLKLYHNKNTDQGKSGNRPIRWWLVIVSHCIVNAYLLIHQSLIDSMLFLDITMQNRMIHRTVSKPRILTNSVRVMAEHRLACKPINFRLFFWHFALLEINFKNKHHHFFFFCIALHVAPNKNRSINDKYSNISSTRFNLNSFGVVCSPDGPAIGGRSMSCSSSSDNVKGLPKLKLFPFERYNNFDVHIRNKNMRKQFVFRVVPE